MTKTCGTLIPNGDKDSHNTATMAGLTWGEHLILHEHALVRERSAAKRHATKLHVLRVEVVVLSLHVGPLVGHSTTKLKNWYIVLVNI